MKKLLVTGSSGLIGSAVAESFHQRGWEVHGADNNMRADFFGPEGDTTWNLQRLTRELKHFTHCNLDIRDRQRVLKFVADIKPEAIVHCAAQPSHDLAAKRPFEDFDVNAGGTLNLLEAARRVSTAIIFVHMSTNKVYGDAPNRIPLQELPTRWDYADPHFQNGIAETMTIDQSKHSLFGASKASGNGSAPKGSSSLCDPFGGKGSITGGANKITFVVIKSGSQQGCSSGESGAVTITFHGVAKASGGSGKGNGATGSLKFKGTLHLGGTSGTQSGNFTVSLSGKLTVKS